MYNYASDVFFKLIITQTMLMLLSITVRTLGLASKHDTSTQYWATVGPLSTTLAQHWFNIELMYRFLLSSLLVRLI